LLALDESKHAGTDYVSACKEATLYRPTLSRPVNWAASCSTLPRAVVFLQVGALQEEQTCFGILSTESYLFRGHGHLSVHALLHDCLEKPMAHVALIVPWAPGWR
jgi:hypothetical protein